MHDVTNNNRPLFLESIRRSAGRDAWRYTFRDDEMRIDIGEAGSDNKRQVSVGTESKSGPIELVHSDALAAKIEALFGYSTVVPIPSVSVATVTTSSFKESSPTLSGQLGLGF